MAAPRADRVRRAGVTARARPRRERHRQGAGRARDPRALVARNAATLPAGIIAAELFGNARNFPNAGMAERPGLVGETDGGTLMLDEIGELPTELQPSLLRLLDDGEYHRLGEAAARRANLRVVGVTNRDLREMKHDLVARMPIRVELPPLSARREDVPLLTDRDFRKKLDALLPRSHRVGDARPDARQYELVYAIIEGSRRPLVEVLPFFSRLMLLNSARQIAALGHTVTATAVPFAGARLMACA